MAPQVSSGQIQVSEIAKKLDFATKENIRLRKAIEENNAFLEQKLQEISDQSNQRNDSHTHSIHMMLCPVYCRYAGLCWKSER